MDDYEGDAVELLPCPFCGGVAAHGLVEDEDSPEDSGHYIQCTDPRCGASTNLQFACGDDPKPLLTEQWNRRAAPHTAAAQAAAVAAAVLAERAEILKLCAAEDTRLNEAADQMHDYHAYDAGNESRARASAISLLSSLIRARTQESGR